MVAVPSAMLIPMISSSTVTSSLPLHSPLHATGVGVTVGSGSVGVAVAVALAGVAFTVRVNVPPV